MLVSDMKLIGALGEAVANDENATARDLTIITESLLAVFGAENQALRLLEAAISREITKQNKAGKVDDTCHAANWALEEVNTLFRSNNLSCKLLSCFFRSECKKYLKEKVGPFVAE